MSLLRTATRILLLCCVSGPAFTQPAARLAELSLEELTRLPVTSVGKRTQQLSDVAGSVYVIRADDIRRAGVTSLPEALRLAPNLQVARVDALQYAITARTGADLLSNKMLVMVDGRTVYSPLFSGVFWEAQDLVLDDIDRIEVLSGSGGTLYGSNAFHGVVNVITKTAASTPGWLVRAAAGNQERLLEARHAQLHGDAGLRISAKRRLVDGNLRADGAPARDRGRRSQMDLRWDAGDARSQLTLQGGAFQQVNDDPLGQRAFDGAHLMVRWIEDRADSRTQWQAYADRMRRDRQLALRNTVDMLDVEGQQEVRLQSHSVVWGAGWRKYHDDADPYNAAVLDLVPRQRGLTLANVFAQADWGITDALRLITGLKAEHNSYSGLEWLPGVRLAWQADADTLVWASASRAARTPARVDADVRSPPLLPSPGFDAEKATIYEVGYRGRPLRQAALSATVFHHRYSDLRAFEFGPAGGFFTNSYRGSLTGLEAWAEQRLTSSWRVRAGWTIQRVRYEIDPGRAATAAPPQTTLGNDARHRFSLATALDLSDRWSLDVQLRRMGARPNPAVPAYTELDARLGWQARRDLELALVGSSLLHRRHVEWGAPPARVQLARSLTASAVWRY